ncbi:MAG: hypothetical protein DBX44_01150 [Oscillospiraceae bacterium]|nr:MAG: hypothetical protein DBX44_01150 [Oscillospiraceae bacterium]
MRLNTQEFRAVFDSIASIGALPNGGCERLSMSDEDMQARAALTALLEEEGFSVWQEPTGSIWARLEGEDPSLPAVLTGSHIDTVRNAGLYDGLLGVMTSYWAMRQIRREGISHRRSIELVVFPTEESARFNYPTIGSKLIAGKVSPDVLKSCLDADGLSLYDALRQRGFDPENTEPGYRRLTSADCFIELHIEQGPLLESRKTPIGIVEAIAAPTRLRVGITGEYAHSGACPMHLRRDALAASAELILAVEKIGQLEAVNHSVAAVTCCDLVKESMNVVPGQVMMSIDIRGTDIDSIDRCTAGVRRSLKRICETRGVKGEISLISRDEPVHMAPSMMHAIRKSCERCRLPYHIMPSGAGHDAMNTAPLIDTGMIFIPCHGGISHNPNESIEWADVEAGYNVLSELLLNRANRR